MTDGGTRAIGVAAVMFALATMVRPQVLLGLPLLAVAWLWAGIGWRRTLALGLATTAAVAALVVPWAIRNDAVLGEPVFVSTNGGDNLCVGYHPGGAGRLCHTAVLRHRGDRASTVLTPSCGRNSETRQLALDYIREEPLSLPWLGVRKLYWTFRTDDDGLRGNESYGDQSLSGVPREGFEGSTVDDGQVFSGTPRTIWIIMTQGYYALVMVAAIAGIVIALRPALRRPRDAAVLSLLGLTLAGVAVPVLFFGDPRFKVPTTPLFAVFAGLALVELLAWSGWPEPKESEQAPEPSPEALSGRPT